MASLLQQADAMFDDLGSQCVEIQERTGRIKTRLETLGPRVESYNPRKQKIREYQQQITTKQGYPSPSFLLTTAADPIDFLQYLL